MTLESKVEKVVALFEKLELEIASFNLKANLHCLSGCGKCCTTPNIVASSLEFLPWAFHSFLEGKAEELLEELKNKSSKICQIYRPFTLLDGINGKCSNYKYRGLICRLFGYAASKDQYGKHRMATCKFIKETQQENYNKTEELINNGLYIPVISDYYMNLSQIDLQQGTTLLPINIALKLALEEVLHYYAYRPLPDGLKEIA
jgi:uncharacterized protein